VRQPAREKAYGIGAQPRALRVDPDAKPDTRLPDGLYASAHAFERMAQRGVSKDNIVDAILNPLHKTPPKIDAKGRESYRIIGSRATLAINPQTRNIATAWPTGERKRKRYGSRGTQTK
jgi:hypothetical protein